MIHHNGLVYSVLMERKRIAASFISTPAICVEQPCMEMDEINRLYAKA